jgi:lipoyl(octanoyl) transferase
MQGGERFSSFTFLPSPHGGGVILERLQLWMDPVLRTGPEAMAVDEWLLETAKIPLLRVYGWQENWGSIGYFGKLTDAEAAFPGLNWVRRWTGGGVVDHRQDWTYSLIIPQGERLADLRGVQSYRFIHGCLAQALIAEGNEVRLSAGELENGEAACFQNPVHSDLIVDEGLKIAGAGQRRSKQGLLHQGSVAIPCHTPAESVKRAELLVENLSLGRLDEVSPQIRETELASKVQRYARDAWIARR